MKSTTLRAEVGFFLICPHTVPLPQVLPSGPGWKPQGLQPSCAQVSEDYKGPGESSSSLGQCKSVNAVCSQSTLISDCFSSLWMLWNCLCPAWDTLGQGYHSQEVQLNLGASQAN